MTSRRRRPNPPLSTESNHAASGTKLGRREAANSLAYRNRRQLFKLCVPAQAHSHMLMTYRGLYIIKLISPLRKYYVACPCAATPRINIVSSLPSIPANMASNFVVTLLSAIQAAASVLVTIGVGVAAAQFELLTPESAKHISQLCVNIFLPCLLIANIGSEVSLDSAPNYVPILSTSENYPYGGIPLTKASSLGHHLLLRYHAFRPSHGRAL